MFIFHLLHAFLVNVLGVFDNVVIQSPTAKQLVSLYTFLWTKMEFNSNKRFIWLNSK